VRSASAAASAASSHRSRSLGAADDDDDDDDDDEEEEEEEEDGSVSLGSHSEHSIVSIDDSDDEDPMHHPGELDVDFESDVWADWDEALHGPIDTNFHRRMYPAGFRWTCCTEPGNVSKGCVSGSGPRIHEMYPPDSDDDDDEQDDDEDEAEEEGFHAGELEVDLESDVWADWDEALHGPLDTPTNREQSPEGFVWSCCGAQGTYAPGCVSD